VADYSPEQIRKYRQELEDINKIEGRLTDQQKERKKFLEGEIRSHQELSENLENNIKLQKEYINGLESIKGNLDVNILKQKSIEKLLKDELELLNNKLKLGEGNSEALRKEIQEKQKQLEYNKQILEVQEEINKSADISTDLSRKITKNILKARYAADNFKESLQAAAGEFLRMADSAATSMLNAQISAIDGLLKSYDGATTSFEKQYALGEVYQDQIKDLYKETNELGASIEDVTKAYGELATGFTDFTMLAEKQREAIADTAVTMERAYGIAQGDFAKGMQNASKMMAMTAGQAETYQRELAATAEALGVPPAQLASQFASMGPQFAKFGNQAGKAFKDLARISKITGMELEKVLAITNKFDTFEGAAEQAGQLNAALGGNFVNAMDLMMATDPAERFEMIRDAIMSTGLTFDDMSYYQKQFYTNALGLSDVGDLALMMSGRMDMMAGSSNQSAKSLIEQKERAAELMTVQEKLNAAMAENAEIFLDMLPLLRDGAELIQKYGHYIAIAAGLVKVASVGLGFYNALVVAKSLKTIASTTADIASTAAKEGQVVANLEQAGSIEVLDKALEKQGNTMKKTSKGAYAAAAGMAAFGVAVLGIGAGVALAANGIGSMAESVSKLDPDHLDAFTYSLIGLGTTMVLLVGAMAALVYTGTLEAAALGLAAFGFGVLLIGGGVYLAAKGIGLMAESFASLASVEGGLLNFAGGLTAIAIAIIAVAGALKLMGNPLAAAGLGVLLGVAAAGAAIGFAISAIGGAFKKETDNMEGMAEVMSAMGNVTAEDAERIQNSFMGIKSAINDISGMKLAALAMSLGKINVDVGVPASQMQSAQAPAQKKQPVRKNQGKIGEILIKFDNDMFEDQVVDVLETKEGEFAIRAALGQE
jgi:hypothetical protein